MTKNHSTSLINSYLLIIIAPLKQQSTPRNIRQLVQSQTLTSAISQTNKKIDNKTGMDAANSKYATATQPKPKTQFISESRRRASMFRKSSLSAMTIKRSLASIKAGVIISDRLKSPMKSVKNITNRLRQPSTYRSRVSQLYAARTPGERERLLKHLLKNRKATLIGRIRADVTNSGSVRLPSVETLFERQSRRMVCMHAEVAQVKRRGVFLCLV